MNTSKFWQLFRKIANNLLLLAVLILLGYVIFLRECKRPKPVIKTVYKTDTVTIIRDTIIYLNKIIYRDRNIPVPIETKPEGTKIYRDSLIIPDTLNLWITDEIRGELIKRDIAFRPVIHQKMVTNTITNKELVPQKGVYLSGILGYGINNEVSFGASIDYINKKNNLYGLQYQRIGPYNFYSFKIGTKLTR